MSNETVHASPEASLRWLPRLGELLLALLMIYSAVMHYKFAPFVAQIVPAWMPHRLFWAYFTGAAELAAGISIVMRKRVLLSMLLLGLMLSLFLLLIHAPNMVSSMIHSPHDVRVLWSFNGTGGVNNALKDFALTLSALMLAMAQEKAPLKGRTAPALRVLFITVVLLLGVEHFFYTRYTPGIPSWSFVSFWIPWSSFWGYATGAFLAFTALMILANKRPRDAAVALGFMILAVATITYAFRMAAHQGSYGELTNTLKDVGVAGGAFILARGLPVRKSPRLVGD